MFCGQGGNWKKYFLDQVMIGKRFYGDNDIASLPY